MGTVRLKRLWTTGRAHRHDVYTGHPYKLPEVGKRFFLFVDGTEGDRLVTSEIEKVNQDGDVITFETRNSRYQLELL